MFWNDFITIYFAVLAAFITGQIFNWIVVQWMFNRWLNSEEGE